MPQTQDDIPLYWASGHQGAAVRTGNHAAWTCLCGRDRPLLGYSDRSGSSSVATLVVCPNCGRRYRVVSPTARGVPSHVQELDSGGSTA